MGSIRKSASWTAVLLMGATLTVAGCGGGNSSSTQNGSSTVAGQNTSGGGTGQNSSYVKFYMDKAPWAQNMDAVGQYAAQKYGVGMKSVPYPDTTSYQAAVDQALQGNNPPDVFDWWSGDQFTNLVATGKISDLTSEWKNYYEKNGLNPQLAKPFTVNGKIYGAPLYVGYWVVFYNKHVFDQYGLQPPKTWDDFLKICATLKSNGVAPIAQTITGQWPGFIWFEELVARMYGTDVYNQLMSGKISYTDPRIINVMKTWKTMENEGDFSKPLDMNTDIPSDFAKGKVGMFLVGQWYQSSFISAGLKPGSDYGEFILPDVNPSAGNVLIYETGPLVVSENGKNKADALKALRNFFEPDVQKKWDDLQGVPPIETGVTSNNPANSTIASDMNTTNYQLLQRYWEATPPDIAQFAVQEFDKFELHPSTYMDDLKAIQQNASQYWSTHKQ